MANESGTWIMYGVSEDDPECLHTVEESIEYINEIGFLPLFKNDIPGFSLEERTVPEYWWSEDSDRDPWKWREIIARSGRVAYGKFFNKKAGFISKEWFPYFANYRRDGYDFDALWDDEKASMRQKKIMDLFSEENADAEYYSFELKQKAGFGKEGEKGFEGTIAGLQMQMYLCMRDFRQRKNKKSEFYGWPIAVYSTPEHLWGYDYVTSAYAEDPIQSGKRIAAHIMDVYPIATAEQIRQVIGSRTGEPLPKKKKEKQVDFPANLLKELNLGITALSDDQRLGLEYAIGMLNDEDQEILQRRFEKGESYQSIGLAIGRSAQSTSKRCKKAVAKLQHPAKTIWITTGFRMFIESKNSAVEELKKEFLSEKKERQAQLLMETPDSLIGISKSHTDMLFRAGICNIGALCILMEEPCWFEQIPGIGYETSRRITEVMQREGFLSKDSETYKLAKDRWSYRKLIVKK